ncbi:MAG TPA: bi-domain-containing oxidoreductase [Bacteroidia bacterium]|nr:bi-domain-containing oxidoreductase [Bacteroidia bacterium]
MEQLTQNLKDGTMQLLEVPFPALSKGCVLVRNHYSLISAGTEGKSVKDARLSYIGKAKARSDELKKVIDAAKTHGWLNTYNMVMNKLEAPSSLGYSCAGEIIDVAQDVNEFVIGDLVACGGNSAAHSEVVAVQKNLCVKIDPKVDLKHACFTTIGAIALQGIRQADLRLGENCVVIGLGLVGQLTLQMLNASGVKIIGIDIDKNQVQLARNNFADLALDRGTEGIEKIINEFTGGYGTDAVIITAGTSSLDPVDLAGELCRKKGKVVIVGAVPTGFKRSNYFKKELDLRMSCSYGPGRYDLEYEEKNLDYPIGYVRWTENRNMQAFAELLKENKLNLDPLITHAFDFQNAPDAYRMILDQSEPFTGIVLKYNVQKILKKNINLAPVPKSSGNPGVAFIGAGSFAQNILLPAVKNYSEFIGIATARPNNSRYIADKYGFKYCAASGEELIADNQVNTVFIVTRNDSHARFVMESLKQHKNVYVEKPLCLNLDELDEIKDLYDVAKVHLMVGFNRRFSPHVLKLIPKLREKNIPVAINYRINAGVVPHDSWEHDKDMGGGRILGEVCNFIDLAAHIAGSPAASLSANSMMDALHHNDTLNINIVFENGSIANISYFSNGNKKLTKEVIEIFHGGSVAVIDDFKTMIEYGKSVSETKLKQQNKGHSEEVRLFLEAVKKGGPTPIPFNEIYFSTLATFKVIESISRNGERVKIEGI